MANIYKNHMKRFCVFLVTPWIAFFSFGQDSTRNIEDVIFNFRKKANSLNFQYNGSKTSNFQNNVSAGIYKLKSLLDDNYASLLKIPSLDSAYINSLLIDYEILEKENISEENINDLNDDLSSKTNSFNPGLYQNGIDGIPVTITTYDSALHKVSGYFVYWNYWLNKDNPQPYAHFNQFTNPSSSDVLVPAIYDIWVQKVGDQRRYPPKEQRTKYFIFLNNNERSTLR